MKMPFGKHKGTELSKLPINYLIWLKSIELKDPLKTEFEILMKTKEIKNKINNFKAEKTARYVVNRLLPDGYTSYEEDGIRWECPLNDGMCDFEEY